MGGSHSVLRYRMAARKVIESALRQHAKGAAAAQDRAGHGVDGAVTTGCHHYPSSRFGKCHCAARLRLQLRWLGDLQKFERTAGFGENASQSGLHVACNVATRGGVDHYE